MASEINIKSNKSELEKTLLKLMIDLEVDQTDIARYEGVSPQAINNRLKRLSPKKMGDFKQLIIDVAQNKK